MSVTYTGPFPLKNTLCKDCSKRFSRIIVPLDYESYGIDLDEYDLEEGEDLLVEQHMCLISREDLDGIVKKCNHYDIKIEFFSSDFF